MGQVVEDYDASKCSVFYSESSFSSTASPHPEPVSGIPEPGTVCAVTEYDRLSPV